MTLSARTVAVSAGVLALVLSGCSSQSSSDAATSSSSPAGGAAAVASTSGPSSPASPATDAAVAACTSKPAQAEVLYRSKNPGLDWTAERLGGQYQSDHTNGQCLDVVSYLIATTPDGAGYCGQVAWSSDNPGYDESAQPAPPLKKVLASKGSCG